MTKIGHIEGEGLVIKSIKDSGATRSIIDERLWEHIPNRHLILQRKVRGTVTIANAKPLPIVLMAKPTITFYSKDNRPFSITQAVYIAQGLQYEAYLGQDILSSDWKHFETPTTMVFNSKPHIPMEVTIPQVPHIFEVEIHNAKQAAVAQMLIEIEGGDEDFWSYPDNDEHLLEQQPSMHAMNIVHADISISPKIHTSTPGMAPTTTTSVVEQDLRSQASSYM